MQLSRVQLILAALTIALLAACGTPGTPGVAGVVIQGGNRTVAVGSTTTLQATVTGAGVSQTVTWHSSNEAVATITAGGVLTAHTTGTTTVTATSTADPTKRGTIAVTVGAASTTGWTRQLGSISNESGRSVAVDSNGNVYVAGDTGGALVAGREVKLWDIFVSSYDADGVHRWTDQFGTDEIESFAGVVVDSNDNVYVAGSTEGLLGQGQVGQNDGFLRSYAPNGTIRWTVQFGSDRPDDVLAIATSGSIIYVAGATVGDLDGENEGLWDAFIMAFDTSGNNLWVHQFGTEETDSITAMAASSSGTVYVAGSTTGELAEGGGGTGDGFVAAYSSGGSQQWLSQFGSSDTEVVHGVATQGSRVFVVGQTNGQMSDTENAGQWDAYISSFSTGGGHQWTSQYGTTGNDFANGVHVDASGNVYVVGSTFGRLGLTHVGGQDAYIRLYGAAGVLIGTYQFGTGTNDRALAIVTSVDGSIYTAGATRGVMETGYSHRGQDDAYIRKHGPWDGL